MRVYVRMRSACKFLAVMVASIGHCSLCVGHIQNCDLVWWYVGRCDIDQIGFIDTHWLGWGQCSFIRHHTQYSHQDSMKLSGVTTGTHLRIFLVSLTNLRSLYLDPCESPTSLWRRIREHATLLEYSEWLVQFVLRRPL